MPSSVRKKRKLRSGHTRKQTSKQAKKRARAKKEAGVNITNAIVAQHWDASLSTNENFRQMGLVADPNAMLKGDASREIARGSIAFDPDNVEEASIVVKELEAKFAEYEPFVAFCSDGEMLFVRRCIAKYNMDFKAMARDLKLNTLQWTPAQIRRKVIKYSQTLVLMGQRFDAEKLTGTVAEPEPEAVGEVEQDSSGKASDTQSKKSNSTTKSKGKGKGKGTKVTVAKQSKPKAGKKSATK
eukprot:m.358842 g.358842  ORF g.358842 m.358842 type:complete len:241 (+) comp18317_c0_seq1:216-938(+)